MITTYSSCWAHYRGDCDRGMSSEHLLSKAIFPDRMVFVSGFEWCKGAERLIGINSLQRKFLCQKHNNDLSPVDETAVVALGAFATGVSSQPLSGWQLERWLLKTAINLSIGGDLNIGYGMAESKPGWPSPYLLAVAFGDLKFTHNMGAYFIFHKEPYRYRNDEIFITHINREGVIGGFVFGLRGVFVFLSLFPGNEPPPISVLSPGLLPEPVASAALAYRPDSIATQTGRGKAGIINIDWGE